jgi:hypothetical protein
VVSGGRRTRFLPVTQVELDAVLQELIADEH